MTAARGPLDEGVGSPRRLLALLRRARSDRHEGGATLGRPLRRGVDLSGQDGPHTERIAKEVARIGFEQTLLPFSPISSIVLEMVAIR